MRPMGRDLLPAQPRPQALLSLICRWDHCPKRAREREPGFVSVPTKGVQWRQVLLGRESMYTRLQSCSDPDERQHFIEHRTLITRIQWSFLTFPFQKHFSKEFPGPMKVTGRTKTLYKVIERNCGIFRVSRYVKVLASVGFVITDRDHVIWKMRFEEAGTGPRGQRSLTCVPGSLKELTFFQVRISTFHFFFADFTIVKNLPHNFLHPSCSCEKIMMDEIYH